MPPDHPKPQPGGCDHADECPSPGGGHRRLVIALVITVSALVFFSIVSLSVYCHVRRLRRRRQQSLLAAEVANPAPGVQEDAAASDVEVGVTPDAVEGGAAPSDDEVAHHAWHIRTVGLDEAAIESIALTRYCAGAGMLGAADCSVCLAEFRDGELLRLLPACSHVFHIPCIDTWLRAHVSCPLCRADVVMDPATAAAADSDPPAGAHADTDAEQASISIEAMDHELGLGQEQNEQQDLRVQIGHRDLSSSPEPLHWLPGLRVQDFRRAASMDFRHEVSADEGPEDEPNSKENQGNGGSACCKVPSGSGRLFHMKRSLSGGGRWPLASRHSRTRSSMLPS